MDVTLDVIFACKFFSDVILSGVITHATAILAAYSLWIASRNFSATLQDALAGRLLLFSLPSQPWLATPFLGQQLA